MHRRAQDLHTGPGPTHLRANHALAHMRQAKPLMGLAGRAIARAVIDITLA